MNVAERRRDVVDENSSRGMLLGQWAGGENLDGANMWRLFACRATLMMSFCNSNNQYLSVAGNNYGTMSFSEVEMKIADLQKEQVKCFCIIVGDSELVTGESRVEVGLSLMCAAICGECLGCICKEIILLCLRRCCMKRDRCLENSIHNFVISKLVRRNRLMRIACAFSLLPRTIGI